MELSRFFVAIAVIAGVAALLLFTPYEAYLEGILALGMVAAAMAGFLMHPRREVFYVRTTVRLIDPDRNQTLEQDFLAVRAELARLWLLFVPTLLAAAILVFFAAGGPTKFSYLNWIFSSRYSYIVAGVLDFSLYASILVLVLLSAWLGERRVMRDAEACIAQSLTIFPANGTGWVGRVSYAFRGERGEYYGGDCSYFGFSHPRELASVVFHNVRKPDVNKIAMGFLFCRFVILGRGVTDLDKQTAAAQAVLAATTPAS
jgi:hypothetical protein